MECFRGRVTSKISSLPLGAGKASVRVLPSETPAKKQAQHSSPSFQKKIPPLAPSLTLFHPGQACSPQFISCVFWGVRCFLLAGSHSICKCLSWVQGWQIMEKRPNLAHCLFLYSLWAKNLLSLCLLLSKWLKKVKRCEKHMGFKFKCPQIVLLENSLAHSCMSDLSLSMATFMP